MQVSNHKDGAFGAQKCGPCLVRKGDTFYFKNTAPTVKHGGGSIMMWACFFANDPENLVKVEGIMTQDQYIKILDENMKPLAEWVLQNKTDPKQDL